MSSIEAQLPSVEVVLNPSSGARLAPAFFERTLEPLLRSLEAPFRLWTTEHEGDGERVGRELAAKIRAEGKAGAVVFVLGGDGSSYELINGVFAPPASTSSLPPPPPPFVLDLVPLPLGTANALYSHLHHRPAGQDAEDGPDGESSGSSSKRRRSSAWWRRHLPKGTTTEDEARLASVGAWLDVQGRPDGQRHRRARLPLTRTTFHPALTTEGTVGAGRHAQSTSPPSLPRPTISHIVLSLALHAALLHLSEALRETEPGIERFKRAAEQVLHVRHEGSLTFGDDGTTTTRWDPRRRSFEPISAATVDGPFAYLLSTPFVARLEPSFLVAPLLSGLAPADVGRSMDVLVLRPDRSEAVRAGGQDAWVARVKEILGGAYQGESDGRAHRQGLVLTEAHFRHLRRKARRGAPH